MAAACRAVEPPSVLAYGSTCSPRRLSPLSKACTRGVAPAAAAAMRRVAPSEARAESSAWPKEAGAPATPWAGRGEASAVVPLSGAVAGVAAAAASPTRVEPGEEVAFGEAGRSDVVAVPSTKGGSAVSSARRDGRQTWVTRRTDALPSAEEPQEGAARSSSRATHAADSSESGGRTLPKIHLPSPRMAASPPPEARGGAAERASPELRCAAPRSKVAVRLPGESSPEPARPSGVRACPPAARAARAARETMAEALALVAAAASLASTSAAALATSRSSAAASSVNSEARLSAAASRLVAPRPAVQALADGEEPALASRDLRCTEVSPRWMGGDCSPEVSLELERRIWCCFSPSVQPSSASMRASECSPTTAATSPWSAPTAELATPELATPELRGAASSPSGASGDAGRSTRPVPSAEERRALGEAVCEGRVDECAESVAGSAEVGSGSERCESMPEWSTYESASLQTAETEGAIEAAPPVPPLGVAPAAPAPRRKS